MEIHQNLSKMNQKNLQIWQIWAPFSTNFEFKFRPDFLKAPLKKWKVGTRRRAALKKKQKSSLWTGKLQLLLAKPASVI